MPLSTTDREKLLKRATVSAVGVALILIVAKFYAWLSTGSVSLQATLMDSILDVAASAINYLAIRHSLKPADHEHRFGHGKIEALAGLGQSLFIMVSAIFIFKSAFERFFSPHPLSAPGIGIGVMIFSIFLTFALLRYQKYVVAKTKSTAIGAEAVHYQSDILINLSVLLSLALSGPLGLLWIDALMGAGIALFILVCIIKISRTSLDILMDHELPDDIRRTIKKTVLSHPKVHGLHDLRTRSTGSKHFFQLHLELDDQITLHQAHEISFEVETLIKKHYPNAEIIIHQDVKRDQH